MSMNWKDTQAALKARLLADHLATKAADQATRTAEAKARQFAKPFSEASAARAQTARSMAYAQDDTTIRPLKRRNKNISDPEARFSKGDLVQCKRIYLMRQRGTHAVGAVRKDEETKGYYYGRANSKGGVYVDWIISSPIERLQRQVVREDYLEPLGTPR